MPTYVTLLRNTAQGAKEIKNFRDAVKESQGWITRDGGRVVAAYALQGSYDFLWITEFPDEIGAMKSLLSAAQRGLVSTETTVAIPIEKFLSLTDQM